MTHLRWIGCWVVLAACGHARLVQRTPEGGTLALKGLDRGKALEDAHRKMAEHCGADHYVIVHEGETVVGQDHVSSTKTKRNKDGSVVESSGSSVRNAVEWRIDYRCGTQASTPWQDSPPNVAYAGDGARSDDDGWSATGGAPMNDEQQATPPPRHEPQWDDRAARANPDDPCVLARYRPPEGIINGLPSACYQYKLGLTCLARCDRLPPAARDGYRSAWSAVESSLQAAATPETWAGVAQGCQSAADALLTAGQAAGCGPLAPRD